MTLIKFVFISNGFAFDPSPNLTDSSVVNPVAICAEDLYCLSILEIKRTEQTTAIPGIIINTRNLRCKTFRIVMKSILCRENPVQSYLNSLAFCHFLLL